MKPEVARNEILTQIEKLNTQTASEWTIKYRPYLKLGRRFPFFYWQFEFVLQTSHTVVDVLTGDTKEKKSTITMTADTMATLLWGLDQFVQHRCGQFANYN